MNTKLITSIALTVGAAGATAFLDSLVNSGSPFCKAALSHAGLAAVVVMVACAKQSFLPPKSPPSGGQS